MKIHSDAKLLCRIDEENLFTYQISWFFSAEPGESENDLLSLHRAAENWVGGLEAPFRVPNAGGAPVELADVRITGIAINALGENCCEARLTGCRIGGGENEHTGGITDHRNREGEHRRQAVFKLKCSDPLPLFPAIGEPVSWAGDDFVCEDIQCVNVAGDDWEVTLKAFRAAFRIIRGPVVNCDETGEKQVEISYFVATSDYGSFLAERPVDSPAAWAGEDFVVRRVSSSAAGPGGFEVNLIARKVTTRMLEATRRENFVGFDELNQPRREIIHTSRWLVHADDLADFERITGSAAEWAGDDTIITRVTPKRRSDLEYELEIEAQHLYNPGLFRHYQPEDRSNLAGRVDVSASLCEFLITPEMAGYRYSGGDWVGNSGWDGLRDCPFVMDGPLERNRINTVVRTILLTEVRYRFGGLSGNLRYLTDWGNESRIHTGTVGGISGSFLKIDLDSEELYDNFGYRWTRFTAQYQLAPGKLVWNANYWAGK